MHGSVRAQDAVPSVYSIGSTVALGQPRQSWQKAGGTGCAVSYLDSDRIRHVTAHLSLLTVSGDVAYVWHEGLYAIGESMRLNSSQTYLKFLDHVDEERRSVG